MCGPRPQPSPVALRERPDGELVGDREREAHAELLADATAAGLLTVDELDARLARTWAARTAGDLATVTADLPQELVAQHRSSRARHEARAGALGHLRAYLAVMTLLVAIWAAAGLSEGGWYPWPVWPALGWGIPVVLQLRGAAQSAR